MTARDDWQRDFDAAPVREVESTTMSGVPVEAVYGPDDGPFPGQYPYTRGPYASMYRSKLWTMRMFAGFGTAVDTNERFQAILAHGGDGLSTAFDLPTLMGRDSRRPDQRRARSASAAWPSTRWPTWRTCSPASTWASVTTSMTINSPAAVILAMYVATAEKAGVERARLGGTLQNDILKEYQAQKEFIFPPRPIACASCATPSRFSAAEMPRWHPVSHLRLPHPRGRLHRRPGAGLHPRPTGSPTWSWPQQAGLDVDAFAPRLSFFFNAHIDFFEEIAKYRAARRIWARWMKERYGAADERSLRMRFHTQTAGVSLTAQQPELNIARTAIEALAGVLGGTQSLHTNSMDEALALPTEKAARIALRTQQVIAHETGVANVADPLGGSWYVEALTDELERQAEEIFAHLDDLGDGSMLEGVHAAHRRGLVPGRDRRRRLRAGAQGQRRPAGRGRRQPLHRGQRRRPARPAADHRRAGAGPDQAAAGGEGRPRRRGGGGRPRPAAPRTPPTPRSNLMPALIEAVRTYATEGEIIDTLADVFGRHTETPYL